MKNCTYRLGLDELLNAPMGLLTLQGRDGDDDGNKGDPDANDDAKGGDDKSKSGEGDDADKSDKKKAVPSADEKRIAALEEEKQRFYDQREELKVQLKEKDKEIAKLKKDGTPDEALKAEVETTTKANEKLTAENTRLRLENAFLTENGFDWVDPKAALRLADLDAVEIDEKTGKVVGLNSALTKLAKDSPYLLKPKADDEDKDKDGEDKKPRRTGQPPRGGTQKQSDAAAREAKLRAKYPALRR
ncbi:scaffolding protein [Microbacterium phage DannyDe]|nr:scaffolding protein [Microbacterium phage DannyDe]